SRHGGPPEGPRQTCLSAIQEPVRSARSLRPKIAVHCVLVSSLTVPSAEQPFQPPKIEPGAGVAVSTTVVPRSYAAEQVAPQSMPGGLLVTVPEPAPNFETLSVARRDGRDVKLAVQVFSMSSVTLPSAQSGSPLQLTNLAPGAGVAVSVTTVPRGKLRV